VKVLYPLIRGGAGGDVYFERLASSMSDLGFETDLQFYPRFLEFILFLARPLFRNHRQCDVIHSSVECGFIFKKKSKPLVVTVHHLVFNPIYQKYTSLGQKVYHKLLFGYTKRSLNAADLAVAISENTKKEIERVFGIANIEVIYNGIDTNTFKPIKVEKDFYPDKTKLLFVGNLTKRKGADLLPKIMQRLDERFVLFYTSGLRTKKIFSDRRMIPLGKLDLSELVEAYNLCDIVIAPSRLEGFGYSAAEAMACGKPVVATDCSSLPELVTDGKGGFLCEIDNAEEFAERIRILAEAEELRRQMGEYNRQRILAEFDLLKMSEKYQTLYERLT